MMLYEKKAGLFPATPCSSTISNKPITKYFWQVIIDDVMTSAFTYLSRESICPRLHKLVYSKLILFALESYAMQILQVHFTLVVLNLEVALFLVLIV